MINKHFIFDYETIGQDVFSVPVVNCSYYIFDWDRFTSADPYTFEELTSEIKFAKFNIRHQVDNDGCKFNKEDLAFWTNNPKAKQQITPSPDDILIDVFIDDLTKYVSGTKIVRWWSRSNTFDPILLHRNFRDYSHRSKLDNILPFWLVRDIRTYIDTRFDFKIKKNGFCPLDDEAEWERIFIPHNSVHDVAADILRIQRIERTIHL